MHSFQSIHRLSSLHMNSTNGTAAALPADIIQEVYEGYVYILVLFSSTALLFYATLTALTQEREFIWSRPFSLPSILYVFARHGSLIKQGLVIAITFIPLGRSCNILADVQNFVLFLPAMGVQGLLIIRAYSICGGNKILFSALAFGFVSYFSLCVYAIVIFPGCTPSSSISSVTSEIISNVIALVTDLIIFGICMWKVWGTWRLKRNNGIRSSGRSLISVLLTQSILRCCFAITITAALVPLVCFAATSNVVLVDSFTLIQNALSATLLADFTLDLRRLNSAKIEASQLSLPPLQLSNVLQRVHQSILVEMATPDEREVEEEAGDYDYDYSLGSVVDDV